MKPLISKRGSQWVCIAHIPGRTPVICYGETPASVYFLWSLSCRVSQMDEIRRSVSQMDEIRRGERRPSRITIPTDLPATTREAWYN